MRVNRYSAVPLLVAYHACDLPPLDAEGEAKNTLEYYLLPFFAFTLTRLFGDGIKMYSFFVIFLVDTEEAHVRRRELIRYV